MNHLAHTFLSFDREDILPGNLFCDMMSAAEVKALPDHLQNGIRIHRWIDQYTDSHPVILALNRLLADDLGRYASVASDIYFDHFLSTKWTTFSDKEPLDAFCKRQYVFIKNALPYLPKRIHHAIGDMMAHDWLMSFGQRSSLEITFDHLSRRAKFDNNFGQANAILDKKYFEIEAAFMEFFPELTAYTKLRLEEIQV